MHYAIVYSSCTGNTAQLAATIHTTLPAGDCLYYGAPDQKALEADVLYVGFWTDKGTCDETIAAFLQSLTTQKVFLFGTAGFGGDADYFEKILDRVRENLAPGVELVGTYVCQGKMPQAVRQRYEAMEDSTRRTAMLSNFDQALGHPDAKDLEGIRAAITR